MQIKPKIIHRIIDGRPYYEIKYYDTVLRETCIGYGSYTKKFVEEWLKEEFNCVKSRWHRERIRSIRAIRRNEN